MTVFLFISGSQENTRNQDIKNTRYLEILNS